MTNQPKTQYLQCVISPPNSRLRVQCRVYPSRRAMHRAIRVDTQVSSDCEAYCATFKDSMPRGTVAVVYFNKNDLTIGTVAHEFTHAGLAIMARRRIASIPCTTEFAPAAEEQLADIIGEMTDSFKSKYGL